MSKRNSVGKPATNTLFNYFTSPSANKKVKPNNKEAPANVDSPKNSNEDVKIEKKKRDRQPTNSPEEKKRSDSEDEAPITSLKRKRIRLNPVESDDSGDENKVDNIIEATPEKVSLKKQPQTLKKKLQERFEYDANTSTSSNSEQKKPSSSSESKGSSKDENHDKALVVNGGVWAHTRLEWLKPGKLCDANKRKPDHPDYDPSTLYVPPSYIKEQTPAHKQWWEMKAAHFDCVLFFKVGKFYELYHMDAAVGVNELGFSYMKGDFAHSGFPESAYARMVSTLVSKGYKVARVEQTETPDMMQQRVKLMPKTTKHDKVVRREICQVTLRGTQVCGLQDPGPDGATANYLMSITEEEGQGCSSYGVCFVDTSIGLFHLGQFKDDKHSSGLLTTLAHYPPVLIVYDRKSISPRTSRLLSTHCHGARREPKVMWPPERTLQTLAQKYYKTDADSQWPEGLQPYLHEGDMLGLTPAANSSLAIKALGGCVAYLTDCLLDIQVLGMCQFTSYAPPDVLNNTMSLESTENRWEGGSTMVLDAITLRNLRIVQDEGCLYDKLNFCSTAFGKRLLYQWVCAPSCNLAVIKERQEAVRLLFENQELCQDAKNILSNLPDLERLLAKVHALGNLQKSKDHPDSRAILFTEKVYSKRKVLDFIAVLNGFSDALKLAKLFSDTESKLLTKVLQFKPKGKFPDYTSTLKFFKEAFNQAEAEKEGVILPGEGVDQEYDNILQQIKDIERESKKYLSEQESFFHAKLKYTGSDKKRYQIEVPQNAASKAGIEYQLESARQGFKRFSTAETREFLASMMAAEEQKTRVLKDLSRRIFEKFSLHYEQWEAAVQCVATLDILLAFAEFARQQSNDVCLPRVTFDADNKPYISIVDGRHPCIPVVNEFIPNDTVLGKDASLLLLTGPNMGGKSTLMRQVGLLTVLAHLGSYVPAQECEVSLVDRIFTRLGASDDILSGQSTFLVEMNETAAIVKHASVHSLVLLDELGRGTSTYDGTAIASAVCVELAERACRVVFSTHYHAVVHHLASHSNVVLGHMACMVETDETTADGEDNIPEETITFLYKLTPGACPKSYGFNAARLAGIPKLITRRAHQISKNIEREATCVRAFRDIMKMDGSPGGIRELLAALSI